MLGPVVPIVPGVPPLLNPVAVLAPALLFADAPGLLALAQPVWGLFLNGSPVVVARSVASFAYKQDYLISDYPLEQGAFDTYDKVQVPFDVRLRFTAGDSADERQALLTSVAAIIGDLNLYDVVTPEVSLASCNVTHYDYHRTATDGVGLLKVDVWLTQVRVSAPAQFSQTAAPSGADPQSTGSVQGSAPTAAQNPAPPGSNESALFSIFH